ncbi:MAG TPA: hypothetical protein VN688_14025, partial [Gemmataceae bacterium]|nr:hypothetical protein [Gemmataceae bacterium]
MPINFACPRCMRRLSIATRKAGSEVGCPACKQKIIVPEPPPEDKPLPGILFESGPLPAEPTAASPESDAPALIDDEPMRDGRYEDERRREPLDDDYDPFPIRRRKA